MTVPAQSIHVHVVSHTHWDREWYLTYEQFRLRLVGLVDRLLDLMEARPDFRYFHLDGQTIVLEDYLEIRPRQEERLRRLIGEGRILVGPWYDMPDEFLVSGESIVRNLALGHRIASRFGTPMPVGYLPDLFGHVGQMPQILRHFGLDNAVLWRGFGGPRAEYWWEAPDGSRVLMLHLPPEGYCNALRLHLDPDRMIERARHAIHAEAVRTSTGQVLLMNGVDHVEPHAAILDLIEQAGAANGHDVTHSTLPDYVGAVRTAVNRPGKGVELEAVRGELRSGEDYANLLPGVLSARVYLKQANARIQALIEKRAEPLAAWARMLGTPYPDGELAYAWKTLLQNHPHDSICGCSVDRVHEENMTRFARVEQVASLVASDAAEAIAGAVPRGPGGSLRLVAINTSGHAFSGLVEATVDLPYASAEPHRAIDANALDRPVVFWPEGHSISAVTGHDGQPVAFEILDEVDTTTFVLSRREPPWPLRVRRLRLAWMASLPACGYGAFDCTVSPGPAGAGQQHGVLVSTDRSAENAYIRLTLNDDGTVDVVDKRSGTTYRRCGNLEDVGDVGDEYTYAAPARDLGITSADAVDVAISRVHAGPLRVSFQIDLALPLPTAAAEDRRSRHGEKTLNRIRQVVSLDAGSPCIGWQITVDNTSRDHRLRVLFPIGVAKVDRVRAGTAFAVADRPARREVPAAVRVEAPVSFGPTEWVSEAGNEEAGAVLLGEGLMEYEAVEGDDGMRLGLTLLRCVGYLSRDDLPTRPSGHAGPGLPTPGAQCLGTHSFRLAFEPRTARPSNGALLARASTFASPPHVVPAFGSAAALAPAGAFLGLDTLEGEVQLSACYWSAEGDALVVRVFNPNGEPARVRLSPTQPALSASRVDFLEREVEPLTVDSGAVELGLGAFAIETVVLRGGL
jgi:alpha-mannosidase